MDSASKIGWDGFIIRKFNFDPKKVFFIGLFFFEGNFFGNPLLLFPYLELSKRENEKPHLIFHEGSNSEGFRV